MIRGREKAKDNGVVMRRYLLGCQGTGRVCVEVQGCHLVARHGQCTRPAKPFLLKVLFENPHVVAHFISFTGLCFQL